MRSADQPVRGRELREARPRGAERRDRRDRRRDAQPPRVPRHPGDGLRRHPEHLLWERRERRDAQAAGDRRGRLRGDRGGDPEVRGDDVGARPGRRHPPPPLQQEPAPQGARDGGGCEEGLAQVVGRHHLVSHGWLDEPHADGAQAVGVQLSGAGSGGGVAARRRWRPRAGVRRRWRSGVRWRRSGVRRRRAAAAWRAVGWRGVGWRGRPGRRRGRRRREWRRARRAPAGGGPAGRGRRAAGRWAAVGVRRRRAARARWAARAWHGVY
mmetsp:Transcript_28541/g.75470  ORF Transcript_28541/g.75470 Transcript_28541/m.75470 type:complete len:268 (-) Transcript_28541:96-899(-)